MKKLKLLLLSLLPITLVGCANTETLKQGYTVLKGAYNVATHTYPAIKQLHHDLRSPYLILVCTNDIGNVQTYQLDESTSLTIKLPTLLNQNGIELSGYTGKQFVTYPVYYQSCKISKG